jgi:hypothetical protein
MAISANDWQLQEVGDFHHPPRRINAEHKTFCYHRTVCGALNRQFFLGAVQAHTYREFRSTNFPHHCYSSKIIVIMFKNELSKNALGKNQLIQK